MTTSQLRNSIRGSVQRCGLLLVVLLLSCFALPQRTQAVVPAPDGGYPNFTTAEGTKALQSLTTGAANTAVGWYSLFSNAQGSFNTATGAAALLFNTADDNTAFGAAALLFNSTGSSNTAVGTTALLNNAGGVGNTATGHNALSSNSTGFFNTATGYRALNTNSEGDDNTAIGFQALFSNTTGGGNTAIGRSALIFNTTGDGNIALGPSAGLSVTSASNVICIGTDGNNVDDSCFIGNIFDATSPNGVGVFINSNGRLGAVTSSRRFKEEIKPMERASEALFALTPVTFRYKKDIDPQGFSQLGLVAEEVQKVNRDLVVRDKDGKPYSVRYEQVNAMLLNEFLKEHREVEELKSTVAEQRKGMEAMAAQLKEQAAQIQKVNDKVEMKQFPVQMVAADE